MLSPEVGREGGRWRGQLALRRQRLRWFGRADPCFYAGRRAAREAGYNRTDDAAAQTRDPEHPGRCGAGHGQRVQFLKVDGLVPLSRW